MILGKGKHGTVTDNFDGTVTKITTDGSEFDLFFYTIRDIEFKYVSNVIETTIESDKPRFYCLVKEKLQHDEKIPAKIKQLEKAWDDSLVHSQDLFAFINSYLEADGAVPFEYMRAVITFHRYLYVEHKTILPLFFELAELVQELKSYNIYFIDWNEANFGLRNNHLALFELGGAKIK